MALLFLRGWRWVDVDVFALFARRAVSVAVVRGGGHAPCPHTPTLCKGLCPLTPGLKCRVIGSLAKGAADWRRRLGRPSSAR